LTACLAAPAFLPARKRRRRCTSCSAGSDQITRGILGLGIPAFFELSQPGVRLFSRGHAIP
jgi:hypothetical protein